MAWHEIWGRTWWKGLARTGATLAAAAAVGGAASAQVGRRLPVGPPPTPPVAIVPVRATQAIAPQQTEARVQLAWEADPVTFSLHLQARVEGAHLHVAGYVPNEAVRRHALHVARSHSSLPVIDGLKVHPHVVPRSQAVRPAADVLQSAREVLAKEFGEQAAGIDIHVERDGRVRVTGTVASLDDLLAVNRHLRRVTGCTAVMNQLTIGAVPAVAPATGRTAETVKAPARSSPIPSAVNPTSSSVPTVSPAAPAVPSSDANTAAPVLPPPSDKTVANTAAPALPPPPSDLTVPSISTPLPVPPAAPAAPPTLTVVPPPSPAAPITTASGSDSTKPDMVTTAEVSTSAAASQLVGPQLDPLPPTSPTVLTKAEASSPSPPAVAIGPAVSPPVMGVSPSGPIIIQGSTASTLSTPVPNIVTEPKPSTFAPAVVAQPLPVGPVQPAPMPPAVVEPVKSPPAAAESASAVSPSPTTTSVPATAAKAAVPSPTAISPPNGAVSATAGSASTVSPLAAPTHSPAVLRATPTTAGAVTQPAVLSPYGRMPQPQLASAKSQPNQESMAAAPPKATGPTPTPTASPSAAPKTSPRLVPVPVSPPKPAPMEGGYVTSGMATLSGADLGELFADASTPTPAPAVSGGSPATVVFDGIWEEAPPPAPRPDRLRERIEAACAGRARNVSVNIVSPKVIQVGFEVRDAAEGDRLVTTIALLPELAPYQVDFDIQVAP